MNILVIGGSGFIGKMIVPFLRQRHETAVFDLLPPADGTAPHICGDVAAAGSLSSATAGRDAVVYLAMGKDAKGDVGAIGPAYDVNVRGVHHACAAAVERGVRRFVYMSTLSVYGGEAARFFGTEDELPDPPSVYGFTKWLGEEVCRYFARVHKLSCIALRLNCPVEDGAWEATYRQYPDMGATCGTDIARAVLAAVECRHEGFDAVFISGDFAGRKMSLAKAKSLLGWTPEQRP
ncbi:MAG: NAD(P)-dependent oxidoreductase [Planctomycetota bacterium]